MTNEELAVLIKNGDDGYLPQLWEQVRRLIAMKARLYMDRHSTDEYTWFEIGDLIDSGYFAVIDACRLYEPGRGSFLTILDYALKTTFAEVSGTRTSKWRHDPLRTAKSLEAPIFTDSDDDTTLLDVLSAGIDDIENLIESVYTQDLHAALDDALSTLPSNERRALVLKYYFNIDYSEQAREGEFSKQYIANLASDGLWKIRLNTGVMRNLASFLNYDELDNAPLSKYIESNNGDMTDEEASVLLL